MKFEFIDIDEEIKIQHRFKTSVELVLSGVRALEGNNLRIIDNIESYFNPAHILRSFEFNLKEDNYCNKELKDHVRLTASIIKDEDKLNELWEEKHKSDYTSIYKQSEIAISKRIDHAFSFDNRHELIENSWINKDNFLDIQYYGSHFYEDIDFGDAHNLHHILIQKYEAFYVKTLHKIEKVQIYLDKIKKLLFCLDKRTQFRQIINFIFKNLDDSHGSVNNSDALQIKNYLLNKNLHEKRFYRWAY
jgi:hypothetical protein